MQIHLNDNSQDIITMLQRNLGFIHENIHKSHSMLFEALGQDKQLCQHKFAQFGLSYRIYVHATLCQSTWKSINLKISNFFQNVKMTGLKAYRHSHMWPHHCWDLSQQMWPHVTNRHTDSSGWHHKTLITNISCSRLHIGVECDHHITSSHKTSINQSQVLWYIPS